MSGNGGPPWSNVAILVAATTLSILAAEAFLFWDPLEIRTVRPAESFDRRGPLDVVRDVRASGSSAYPVLAVTRWLASPLRVHDTPVVALSGVPRSTTVMCNEDGSYVLYESDRFGFNAPDEQWDRRAEVALVGDSFVEGWCVPREDSAGGLIRRDVPATLNVGYTGHGPLSKLGTLREYLAPHRPLHVFWFFYEGNDLPRDLPREMTSPILRRYMEPTFTQHLQRHAGAIGDELRRRFDAEFALWEARRPDHPLTTITRLRTLRALAHDARQAMSPPERENPPIDLFRDVLAEAKRTVEEWGGLLHFVYLPDLPSVTSEEHPIHHRQVLRVAAELELNVVDLLPDFRDHAVPLSLFPYEEGRHLVRTRGLHYNRAGHRLVAQRVLDVIERYRR